MTIQDKERLARLDETFRMNFQLTRLYKSYLERCPDIISPRLVDELCADGDFTKEEALCALLGELFGIDSARSAEDRIFMRK